MGKLINLKPMEVLEALDKVRQAQQEAQRQEEQVARPHRKPIRHNYRVTERKGRWLCEIRMTVDGTPYNYCETFETEKEADIWGAAETTKLRNRNVPEYARKELQEHSIKSLYEKFMDEIKDGKKYLTSKEPVRRDVSSIATS
jgi:hypothetical protein